MAMWRNATHGWKWALIVVVMVGLTGCRPAPNPNIIQWQRDPNSVIVRVDVTGGDQEVLTQLNEVPRCTVYGDNRVVWVNELGGFSTQVLEDRVADPVVTRYIEYLTVAEGIYTYNTQVLTPVPNANPVVETVTIVVNGVTHTTDTFSGWDQNWFGRVLSGCTHLSETPILFEPSEGWLIALVSDYNINAPTSGWSADETGLRLADIAAVAEPVWITGGAVTALWDLIHSSPPNLQLAEDGIYYRVALQVPGVTRHAPPAPTGTAADS